MKKVVSMILLATMLLLCLCSCGGVESKAEAMIDEWNESEDLRLFSFRGEADEEHGIYFVYVDLPSHNSGDTATILMCGDVREKCCEPMAEMFEGSEYSPGFIFKRPNGTVFAIWEPNGGFEWYY